MIEIPDLSQTNCKLFRCCAQIRDDDFVLRCDELDLGQWKHAELKIAGAKHLLIALVDIGSDEKPHFYVDVATRDFFESPKHFPGERMGVRALKNLISEFEGANIVAEITAHYPSVSAFDLRIQPPSAEANFTHHSSKFIVRDQFVNLFEIGPGDSATLHCSENAVISNSYLTDNLVRANDWFMENIVRQQTN
jgi:hypothetical protein